MSAARPARPAHDRTAPGHRGGPRPGPGELVGRAAEMERLAAALAAARTGRGAALFVTGEPGVGKTRLAAEALAAAAAADMVTLRGRASTLGPPVPYRPFVEALLLLARAGLLPEPEALGRYGPVLTGLLGGAPEAGAPAAPHLMVGETLLRLLAAVGRRRGCLLVLDDLHDADPGTLAVLEYLLDNLGQQPAALLLVTGRSPGTAADLATRARQRGAAQVLDLRPLTRPEVHLLVAAELGAAPADIRPELVRRAVDSSAGIPFVVKELAKELVKEFAPEAALPPGATRHPGGPGTPAAPAAVPATVAEDVRRRVDALGPLGAELLGTAALFGPRFPLPVLERAAGAGPAEVSAVLRTALTTCLITPDGPDSHWYAFRYPLAAEALLDGLGPGGRARHAARAARAVAELHPGLPGPWCAHAARLHEYAGDTAEALRLYREAARRAPDPTDIAPAVDLLARAHRLLGPGDAPEQRAAVLESLLDAVARSARFDRLPAPLASPEPLGCGEHTLPPGRRARLYARLGDIATLMGSPVPAQAHLATARALLGDRPDPADAARVDLAAARVALGRPAPDRLRTAARYARAAVDSARRAELPEVACAALLLLGRLEGHREAGTATAHFERARTVALAHRLPAARVSAEVRLAIAATEQDARPARLERARREALRTGLLPLAHEAALALAMERIRRCEFDEAAAVVREAAAEASRRGLGRSMARLRLAEAVRYAHQGRRTDMLAALERLEPLLDAAPGLRPMAYGLARAFCSLLEERHDAAEQELARALAYDTENPATADHGRDGIALLLGVLAGRLGRGHRPALARAAAAGPRWNRQFAGLAHAVLLGREGRHEEAEAAALRALEAAGPYPMARRLGLRLVARAAHEDGWGTPVEWLREAEEYFHGAGLQAAAGAGRALLRGMGASVRQRRVGTERVPPDLRRSGITVREFEVARLVAERISNKDIAGRLHISHRTVEKHVASLLHKTGHPNRGAFATAARDLVP
ncbi:AAA family ATPase [Streptomyces sp. NPDC047014]|uniref:helix-turn-helix transcriptional regulator n=1 Tax=Streptomyces sp. NPDC047014 TaxID=3155736 RepID=UPI0033EE502D